MCEKLRKLRDGLDTLAVFRNIREDGTVKCMIKLLDAACGDKKDILRLYADFAGSLYEHSADFTDYLLKLVCDDDNLLVRAVGQNITPDRYISEAAENELRILQRLSRLRPHDFEPLTEHSVYLPQWRVHDADFSEEYRRRLADISSLGFGKWAKSPMFTLRDGCIVPVPHPDVHCLSELYGYERERGEVTANTLALLDGKPALNVLLYGDAGTGKSTTVKALAGEFADRGLRIIEITKEQLRSIPDVLAEISGNPLKFIIFIDDLSFASDDDSFAVLKSALEGNAAAKVPNAVIYATSNRRHIVRERFSDRDGDDIHRNDTVQELISLSARFGLTVGFSKPDKKSYLDIVSKLAAADGIAFNDETAVKAEAFALRGSGRSPRTARQFVDSLINIQDLTGDTAVR